MIDSHKPFFFQALDALKAGDRRTAAAMLIKQLEGGKTVAKNLPSVSQLAMEIGEVDLAIEASRRAVVPGVIETMMPYFATLGTVGRAGEAVEEIRRLSVAQRTHPSILHFLGTVAAQDGRPEEAERYFREALKKAPASIQTWFALAMLKTFQPGDPDLAAMERLTRLPGAPADARASLLYGIGKAWDDIGDIDRAFRFYGEGAAIKRRDRPVDMAAMAEAATLAIQEFKPEAFAKLIPSEETRVRSLFVTGMPRSGTTLTEQILVSHSAIADGAELNLYGLALHPAGGTLERALAYQEQSASADPWGDIARDYAGLVDQHFRTSDLVVDKSLGQFLHTGLKLHASPGAKIAWLRRNPEDVALSCYTTFFTLGLPWSFSLTDIADKMKVEDRMFAHWKAMFPDRILEVPYEELVADPKTWAGKLQRHFDLPFEEGLESASRRDRKVRTASVAQVREEISTQRVGRASRYEKQLEPFRRRYYD